MSTYDQLRKIIPADQALANKALQSGLEQVKNIFDTTLTSLATATETLESNVGLDAINDLTEPLPANVVAYYTSTLASGSGPDGLLLLTDLIGTATGINAEEFDSSANTLLAMTSAGTLDSLLGSQQVYATMETAASGTWTTFNMGTSQYDTVIPAGWIAPGTYTGNTSGESIQSAFTSGLIPAMQSAVNVIIATDSANCTILNNNWNTIASAVVLEQTNCANAGIVFANLTPNTQAWSLVYGLSSDALDIAEGGSAYVLQSVANLSTQGGQAIVSTMREARNQARLSSAGIQTDIIVSDQYPEPPADLGTTQYTTAQAVNNKII